MEFERNKSWTQKKKIQHTDNMSTSRRKSKQENITNIKKHEKNFPKRKDWSLSKTLCQNKKLKKIPRIELTTLRFPGRHLCHWAKKGGNIAGCKGPRLNPQIYRDRRWRWRKNWLKISTQDNQPQHTLQ